jgi:hypothetical protein
MRTGSLALRFEEREVEGRVSSKTQRTRPARSLQAEYEATRKRVARMSAWLTGPHGEALPEAEWNDRFARYQEELVHLRRLGELVRPTTLRDRQENLQGEALSSEIAELFAA